MILNYWIDSVLKCIEAIRKNEKLDSIENEIRYSAISCDEEGRKKMRMISDDLFEEFEGINEILTVIANELQELDIISTFDRLEAIENKVKENGKVEDMVFVCLDGSKMVVSQELVNQYPESILSVKSKGIKSRTSEIQLGFDLKFANEIISYMKNDYNIWHLNGVVFFFFCKDLIVMNIPFRMDIMNRIYNGFSKYGYRWKNRCVMVNNHGYKWIFDKIKEGWKMKHLMYNEERERFEYYVDGKYEPIIRSFSNFFANHYELDLTIDRNLLNEFLEDYTINMNDKKVQCFLYPVYSPFLKESIINEQRYDSLLEKWIGDYQWKLIYRASDHNYTAHSFHSCCDSVKGPTLILIKTTDQWLVGGYTTQSWSGPYEYKNDVCAFIFTLRTERCSQPIFMKKNAENVRAIRCNSSYGPIFGEDELFIGDQCQETSHCWMKYCNNGSYIYGPIFDDLHEHKDFFSVLDYEVFAIDFQAETTIMKLCKYHDAIWTFVNTNCLYAEDLPKKCSEMDLLHDLDVIHCEDPMIRLRISTMLLKRLSKFLPSTQLVDKEYDIDLGEWIGRRTKCKLLYRASEHGYTAQSFHECCDYKGHTICIFKSNEGWIFGGYTTQSWSGDDIYKEDDQAYVFTLKNPLQTNPVRLKIQREKNIAIRCNPYYGPIFGDRQNCLFQIGSYCNRQYGCYVSTERNDPYEIHPRYQFSSFLNSTPKNWFTILEYEVYQVFDEIDEDVDISTLIDNDIEELVDSPIESSDSESLSFSSNILLDTHIINHQYDDYLIEWFGGLQWKLIYRASEHDYTTESFHEYCDNQGSTLILIKSSEGWIFGGYTTQSWETNAMKDDDYAFLFTLENPHGVPPTRLNKLVQSEYAIEGDLRCGPIFGNNEGSDLTIHMDCDQDNHCTIDNDGTYGYECHPIYKSSLFVNTNDPECQNTFAVDDYEVFVVHDRF